MYRTVVILFAIHVLLACATHPPLSREEWLAMTTRTYEGVTKEQALAAAERLFRLADGDDFMIAHSDEGLTATRNWMVYVVLAVFDGTDFWTIRAVEAGKGVRVIVGVGTQGSGFGGVVTGANSAAPLTLPATGSPVNGTALYGLFWARMDYLLGKRRDWVDCESADERVTNGIVWGTNEALCNSFNVKDEVPDHPLVSR